MLTLSAACERTQDRSPGDSHEPVHPTVAWVLACRDGDTGFGCFPGDSAFTSRTGMALEVLETMGGLDRLQHRDELISWLRGRQQADGGFIEAGDYFHGKRMPWGTESALEPTYWAVRALALLGSSPERPGDVAEFVRARLHGNGGYEAYEYAFGAADQALYTTFWAVGTIRQLGMEVPEAGKTVAYVRSMRNTRKDRGGYYLSSDSWDFSSPAGCYYAVRTLKLLGEETREPDRIKKFLLSPYGQEPDGGFETGHHESFNQDHYSRTEDTYYSVYTLDLIRRPLSDSDSSRAGKPATDCIAWLGSVQNSDGGFARFGISEHTPLPSPSEMRATWHAVRALAALGAGVPRPQAPEEPVSELRAHEVEYPHPCVDHRDPAEVWAYRRIALPIYEHYLEKTGSRLAALGMVNKWAAAAVGPHNGAWITQGRGILMHGWGQCGTMSWLLQEMATSINYASRPSFIIADVNCEILVREDGWDRPHWCLFVPFTYEYPDPELTAPDGTKNGWSVLDMAVDYRLRKRNPDRPRPTEISDRLFSRVRIETIDRVNGEWGTEFAMDSTTTYESEVARELYPGQSW